MLIIKKSRIPNAGKGLFTTSPIRKGDVIVEYKGDNLTWKQCEKRYGKDIAHASYLFFISKNNCVDAETSFDELARYANDANGFNMVKGMKNNSEYDIIKSKAYIVATKNIPARAEILVDYAGDYWEVMKGEDKKKAKKKKK